MMIPTSTDTFHYKNTRDTSRPAVVKTLFELQELCVTESNKKLLIDRCQSAWEKINKLEVVKFKLQLDLNDKKEALAIDRDMLNLDADCANITYKTDSLKTPKG